MFKPLIDLRSLCFISLLLGSAPLVFAESWSIDHNNSRLTFTAIQEGSPFQGEFRRFDAEMRFDPQDLANSRFDVTIEIASVTTGLNDRDEMLINEEWFNADDFPKARFVTKRFEATADGYRAIADLTIQGITHEVELPFTWRIDGERAEMDGVTTLDRTRYEVGKGEDWQGEEMVGHAVEVTVDLTLRRSS